MEVKEINNKETWESFLKRENEKTFLQSWNWGDFQIKMGNKIWRLGVFDKKELVGEALISKIMAKRGTFLLIQHGPNVKIFNSQRAVGGWRPISKQEILKTLLEKLKKIAKEENCSFIRMNPLWERNQENRDILRRFGFRKAPMHANAYESTWKLDLNASEEELLMNMRKTSRYLIRQTIENQDISVEKSESPADLGFYQKLNTEVAQRQKFVPFSAEFIKNEFEVFVKDKQALLLFGKHQGEVAAAALVIFWSDIGFYHQAASSSKYTKFSIPYLLSWEAIKEAKNRGCNSFDFWGFVDPQKNPRHPWAGPTLFKMGFGGQVFEYLKTQDFPISKKYWLTHLFERLRKTKRGL